MDQCEFDKLEKSIEELIVSEERRVRALPIESEDLVEGVLSSGIFEALFRNSDHKGLIRGANMVLQQLADNYDLKYKPFPEKGIY